MIKALRRHSVVLLFALLGVTLYGHTLRAPFCLDDAVNIRDHLHAIDSLSIQELGDSAVKGFLPRRPLANLTFALNYYFHGLRTAGYHAVNIAIHITNSILLYVLILRTLTLPGIACAHGVRRISALAALLWMANPVQIQGVTYIVQRMTSMAALFFLGGFLAYVYTRLEQRRAIRALLWALCVSCWILAMASKEIALTFPALVFIYEWLFFQNGDGTWLRKASFYAAAALGVLLLAVSLVYNYTPWTFLTSVRQPRDYTAWERLLTQGRIVFLYGGLLLYPHPSRLTINHDIAMSRGLLDPLTTLLSFLGLVALIGITLFRSKRDRLMAFSTFWFLGNLAIEILAASIEPMFEHRLYLSSMFFFLPAVVLLSQFAVKSRLVIAIPAATVLVFSVWTFQRNAVWNEPIAFWEDAAVKSPQHFRPYAQLGISYLDAGRHDRAEKAFQKALALSPPYPTEIDTNLGLVYFKTGRYNLARQSLERAISLNAANYVALDLLGTMAQKENRDTEAMALYQRAIHINPDFAASYHNLGVLYIKMGKPESAVKALTHAVELRPQWSEAYSSLGLALLAKGSHEPAIRVLEDAVRIDDKNTDALCNLALTYGILERYDKAAQTYKRLLEVDPTDVEAMHNLGMISLERLQDFEQADMYFRKALATDPNYDQAATVRRILSRSATPSADDAP